MSFDQLLNEVINKVWDNPAGMREHAIVIRETDYAQKLKFEPFSKFSTVYARRYCRLASNWKDWTDQTPQPVRNFAQMASLVHEATHSMQRDKMGDAQFNVSYLLQKSVRFRMECEAYGAQARYFKNYFGLSLNQAMPYYDSLADLLFKYYHLGDGYPKMMCLEEIIRASQ